MPAQDAASASADPPFTGWNLLPLAAIELSSDGQALWANPPFAALTGLTLEAAVGTGWFAALSPDRRAALFTALIGRQDFELEIRLLRADGVKAWIDLNARWLQESASYLCLLHDRTTLRQEAQDARADAQRFRLLADNVPVLIAYYEVAGLVCSYANRQYAATFGLDQRAILGRTVAQVIGVDAAREIQPYIDTMLGERRTVSYVRRLTAADGSMRWIDVSLVPHRVGDELVAGCFVLISDITRHRQADAAVRESEERLLKFMDASVEGIVLHKDGFVADVNAPIVALIGASREALIGRSVFDFIAPEYLAQARQAMATGAELDYEAELVDVDARRIPVDLIVRTVMHGQERLRMTVVRDLRARQAVQQRIRQLEQHDALTGLYNRGAFMDLLEAALAEHRAGGAALALLLIDLDHFKRINDALGHVSADALLGALGAGIAKALPAGAEAGRFGGDQFAILLPGVADAHDAREQAARLRAALQLAVEIGGRSLALTATVGVARFPDDGADADALLRCADAALLAGKAGGGDATRLFEPAMATALDAGLQLEAQLAQALARDEFALLLQPRLGVADGALVAVQALVRWRHPTRGWLAPDDFAAAAEHRHLLRPLADWALRQALRLQRGWADAGLGEVPLALDLAALHPHGMALAVSVGQVLAEQAPAPGGVVLELSERLCADEPYAAQRLLGQLAQLGLPVMLDEFGAGGVALTQLRSMALAGLKIDRALIGALPGDAAAGAVVRAIIGLAHGLGLVVCAVGVEADEQQQWLQAAGCDQLQGLWAGPPMTQGQMTDWLCEHRPQAIGPD